MRWRISRIVNGCVAQQRLMFEYNVGVSPRSTYTVKSMDGDYFEDS